VDEFSHVPAQALEGRAIAAVVVPANPGLTIHQDKSRAMQNGIYRVTAPICLKLDSAQAKALLSQLAPSAGLRADLAGIPSVCM
jgi:hypothetical protein